MAVNQKKVTSISGKMNRSWSSRLLLSFLIIDFTIVVLLGSIVENQGMLNNFYLTLGVIELCIWVLSIIMGRRKARRLLKPLYEMSELAQKLSHVRFDEDKVHDLEDAISRISPTKPDARLSTGDSDLRSLEAAINDLLDRMRESNRQQSRFVSDASHELRTPIAVIKGYANMLDRWGKDDEKVLNESIAAIKSESEHMDKLVEQLLFLARGDSGRNPLKMERVSLTDLIKEVYEESAMIYEDHHWDIWTGISVYVNGDSDMLKQAIRILVDNAAKYTPKGCTITLRAKMNKKSEPSIEVQDEGIGIKNDDVAHVFDRFFRSDPARNRGTGGTGLGLSIAKWIVDRHNGYFEILSREGIGTRMTICFRDQSVPDEVSEHRDDKAELQLQTEKKHKS